MGRSTVTVRTSVPDFTAEYLHKTSEFLSKRYQGAPVSGFSARDRVAAELHENTYTESDDKLRWSVPRAEAHEAMVEYYQSFFQSPEAAAVPRQTGLRIEKTFVA